MRRLTTIGLCLVAALAISAVAVASASAAAPEYGRCIKKAGKAEGGGYSNAGCTAAVGSGAKYEWLSGPGANNKFTSVERFVFSSKYKQCLSARGEEEIAKMDREKQKEAEAEGNAALAEKYKHEAEEHERVANEIYAKLGINAKECAEVIEKEEGKAPAELETVTNSKVRCGGVTSEGEYTSAKTVGNLTTTFTECTSGSFKCRSAGAEEGELVTSTLDGELGIVKKEEAKTKVGLALFPATGTIESEFTCGIPGFEFTVVVTGSVIHEVKANTMILEENETFSQTKGKQKPERFEGEETDVLESSIGGGADVQSGLTLRGLLTNEERIEVNAVV